MRRLFTALLGLGLMGTVVGCCHHTSGVCDCAGPGDSCCYGHGPGTFIDPYHVAPVANGHGEFIGNGSSREILTVAPRGATRVQTGGATATEPPVLER